MFLHDNDNRLILKCLSLDENGFNEVKNISLDEKITSVQAVCSTPLYVKGKTQDWPVVVLHAGDAVVAGEQQQV